MRPWRRGNCRDEAHHHRTAPCADVIRAAFRVRQKKTPGSSPGDVNVSGRSNGSVAVALAAGAFSGRHAFEAAQQVFLGHLLHLGNFLIAGPGNTSTIYARIYTCGLGQGGYSVLHDLALFFPEIDIFNP